MPNHPLPPLDPDVLRRARIQKQKDENEKKLRLKGRIENRNEDLGPQPGESILDTLGRWAKFARDPLKMRARHQEVRDALPADASFKDKALAEFWPTGQLFHKAALVFDPLAEMGNVGVYNIQQGISDVTGGLLPFNPSRGRKAEVEHTNWMIRSVLGGTLSPAQAAGMMRARMDRRPIAEMLVLGTFFDPLVVTKPFRLARKAAGAIKEDPFLKGTRLQEMPPGQLRKALEPGNPEASEEFASNLMLDIKELGAQEGLWDAARGRLKEVQSQTKATQEFMDFTKKLTEVTPTSPEHRMELRASLRDRAIIAFLMGTGARHGDIVSLSWDDVNRALSGEDTVIHVKTRKKTPNVERPVGIMPDQIPMVQEAVDDYKAFLTKGRKAVILAGDRPAFDVTRSTFTENFKAWKKKFPELPDTPRLFRHLVTRQLFLRRSPDGGRFYSVDQISKQLGHANVQTTMNSYIREVGVLLTSADESLMGIFDKASPEARALLQSYISEGRGTARAKGADVHFAGKTVFRKDIGRELEEGLELPVLEAKEISNIPEGPAQDLWIEGAQHKALLGIQTDVEEIVPILNARRQAADVGFKEAGTDSVLKARLKEIKKETSEDLTSANELRRNINEYLKESGRSFNVRRQDPHPDIVKMAPQFKELMRGFIPGNLTESEVNQMVGFVRGVRDVQSTTLSALKKFDAGKPLKEFQGLPSSKVASSVESWVEQRAVFDALKARHFNHKESIQTLITKLKKLRDASPESFGGITTDEGIEKLAVEMHMNQKLMRRFRTVTKTRKETTELADRGVEPPPPKRPAAQGDPERFSKDGPTPAQLIRGPNVMGSLSLIRTSRTIQGWKRGLQARGYSGIASKFQSSIAFIAGGIASTLEEAGRIAASLNFNHAIAKVDADTVMTVFKERLAKGGLRISDPRGSYGSGGFLEGMELTGEIHPFIQNAINRGTMTMDEGLWQMRSWDMITDEMAPSEWAKYYKMTEEATEALSYGHWIIQEVEVMLILEFGSKKLNKLFQGARRPDQYWPRQAIGVLDIDKVVDLNTGARVEQANPNFLESRKHINYAVAVTKGTRYANPIDALGLYVKTAYMMVAEEQAKRLLIESGAITSSSVKAMGMAGAGDMHQVMDDLLKKKTPHYKTMDKARRHNESMYLKVLEDPKGMQEQVKDHVTAMQKLNNEQSSWAQQRLKANWLKDFIFDPDQMEELRKITEESQEHILGLARGIAPASQLVRFMRTGLDMGAPMLHGFPVLISHPVLWGKAWLHQGQVFLDPEVRNAVNNQPEFFAAKQEASIKGGVSYLGGEPLELFEETSSMVGQLFKSTRRGAIGMEKLARRHIVPGNIPDSIRKTVAGKPIGAFERFEAAFNASLEYMRTYLWIGMRRPGMTDDELNMLGAYINKMTGTYNAALSGLTPNMRTIQTSVLFFAPMYRRAVYGLIMDAGQSVGMQVGRGLGVTRAPSKIPPREVYKMAVGLAMVGSIFGSIAYWQGNDKVFEPTTAKFMTMPIGNSNVGIGSAFYSLIRLGGNFYKAYRGTQEDHTFSEERALDDLTSLEHWPDNMLFRWARSQMAPISSYSLDVITGRNFVGDPLADPQTLQPNIGELAQHTGWSVAPFWLQSLTTRGAAGGAIGEYFGARAFDVSKLDKRRQHQETLLEHTDLTRIEEWKEEQAAKDEPTNWASLPIVLRNLMKESHSELEDMDKEIADDDLRRGRKLQQDIVKFSRGSKTIREGFLERLKGIQRKWDRGDYLNPNEFRADFKEATSEFHGANNYNKSLYPNALERFKESRDGRLKENKTFIGDLLYDRYLTEVALNPLLEDEDGDFQMDLFIKLKDDFYSSLGDDRLEMQAYIEERRASSDFPPIFQEFAAAKKTLEPYWDAHDEVFGKGSLRARIIEDYIARGTSAMQARYENSSPFIKKTIQRWRQVRRDMRRGDPRIDAALVKFYGRKSIALQR